MKERSLLTVMALALLLSVGGSFLLAADFDGDSRADAAIFRGSSGLWAAPGITRFYFGSSSDLIAPGDYNGDGKDEAAIYRSSSGLWAVRGVTRYYLGSSGDIPVVGGGGEKTYDYVVKAGDSADLLQALESNTYRSVFVPDGTYSISQVINVDNVRHIVGETKYGTRINFSGGVYLSIEENYCQVENLYLYGGGDATHGILHIPGTDWVTVENCRFTSGSSDYGLYYTSGTTYLKVSNCQATIWGVGFSGPSSGADAVSFNNCQAYNCGIAGFFYCSNLTGCEVQGNNGVTDYGFRNCARLSACRVEGAGTAGFYDCGYLSACTVDGDTGTTDYGFQDCDYISSSAAYDCGTSNWQNCTKKDTGSCN